MSQLEHLNINVGIYRDDGLAVCNKSPRETENIKKEICKIFKENHLKITIDANLKTVDFLDITMDLRTGIHKPFMKENNTPLYVHRESNHPPSILKNIPKSINKRLSSISSNESEFKKAAPAYQEALTKSGYDLKLVYNSPNDNPTEENTNNKRSRKRNVTWFNPPYSENVSTNIGQTFLKLIDKCFPPGHQLHKLLNRNTLKLSYCCMPNIKQIISKQNKTIQRKTEPQEATDKNCNCRRGKIFPQNNIPSYSN